MWPNQSWVGFWVSWAKGCFFKSGNKWQSHTVLRNSFPRVTQLIEICLCLKKSYSNLWCITHWVNHTYSKCIYWKPNTCQATVLGTGDKRLAKHGNCSEGIQSWSMTVKKWLWLLVKIIFIVLSASFPDLSLQTRKWRKLKKTPEHNKNWENLGPQFWRIEDNCKAGRVDMWKTNLQHLTYLNFDKVILNDSTKMLYVFLYCRIIFRHMDISHFVYTFSRILLRFVAPTFIREIGL